MRVLSRPSKMRYTMRGYKDWCLTIWHDVSYFVHNTHTHTTWSIVYANWDTCVWYVHKLVFFFSLHFPYLVSALAFDLIQICFNHSYVYRWWRFRLRIIHSIVCYLYGYLIRIFHSLSFIRYFLVLLVLFCILFCSLIAFHPTFSWLL